MLTVRIYNFGDIEVYNEPEEFQEGESSVVSEVVEEKVVEMEEDENDIQNQEIDEEQRNQQINEYLDMNKEEYLNKEEYQNIEGMNSYDENQEGSNSFEAPVQIEQVDEQSPEKEVSQPEQLQEASDNQYEEEQKQQEISPSIEHKEGEGEGESHEGEVVRHAGLQTNFLEGEMKHVLKYMLEGYEPEHAIVEVDEDEIASPGEAYPDYGNSPIQENEEEQYSTPNNDQVYSDAALDDRMQLFQIANEVKKKDQSRKFVLWETSQMRNEWDNKLYPEMNRAISQKKLEHHWNNDIERQRDNPQTKAKAFDYSNIEEQNKPVHKSKQWQAYNESKIPLLSDHEKIRQRQKGTFKETGDAFDQVPKKNHNINNIFQRSHLQEMLHQDKHIKKNDIPYTHQSFQKKTDPRSSQFAGRPLWGNTPGSSHVQNVNAGRNRIFYSSNIF